MIGMAPETARNARKSPKSGEVIPIEGFDAADRSSINRS